MKLQTLGPDKMQLTKPDGTIVFFSYGAPVAAVLEGKYYKTSRWYSENTTKHINEWLDGKDAETVDQMFFNALL